MFSRAVVAASIIQISHHSWTVRYHRQMTASLAPKCGACLSSALMLVPAVRAARRHINQMTATPHTNARTTITTVRIGWARNRTLTESAHTTVKVISSHAGMITLRNSRAVRSGFWVSFCTTILLRNIKSRHIGESTSRSAKHSSGYICNNINSSSHQLASKSWDTPKENKKASSRCFNNFRVRYPPRPRTRMNGWQPGRVSKRGLRSRGSPASSTRRRPPPGRRRRRLASTKMSAP